MRAIIAVFIILSLGSCTGTEPECTALNLEKIPHPKIRRMLATESLCAPDDFARLRALCHEPGDTTFRQHLRSYLIEQDIETVWKAYTTISPVDTWRGKMVNFGVQYDRHTQQFRYLDDSFPDLQPGQMLFMNLRLLGGWVNLAVAHEIMEVNADEKRIKICYVETGAAKGSQIITFHPTPEGQTRVDHLTYYRSASAFRDKRLYPSLHEQAISEFHGHIRAYILSNQ